jgi:small nuclear ribonucleoprotein D3
MSVGVPLKLLHESMGHVITCELITGDIYRGKLVDSEDSMNVQLEEVTVTHRDGHVVQLDTVYIRGSHIRFFVVPDMLKNAPMFKNIGPGGVSRGRGLGIMRGRGAAGPRGGGITCSVKTIIMMII